jgi:hypothetical protein
MMTPAQFAQRLNGRQYTKEWFPEDQKEAKAGGNQ